MPTPFPRSLRAIEDDGRGLGRWIAPVALAFLGAWGVWMGRAEVPVFAASPDARLVRERAVHPIESAVAGRVVAVHAQLEQAVEAGTLLVELDAGERALALAEETARLAAVEREVAALGSAIAALEAAREDARAAAVGARREAELELETRRLALGYAEEEASRLGQLGETGDVSKLAASKARTEAGRARVAVEAQVAALERQGLDARREDADRAAILAQERRSLAEREGARGVHAATIARLEHELAQCRIVAPAAGVVGELAALTPGRVVGAGERLGSIVANGALAVEASFEPADALGRIRVGQPAELALAGFPRAEFGALDLAVARIAGEARDGKIRVELALTAPDRARVPLEHGLPGAVRVEIERTTPAHLVLRAVGAALGVSGTADG